MSDFLYTPEGWLDFDYIYDQPAWLIVLIGKRQVDGVGSVQRLCLLGTGEAR